MSSTPPCVLQPNQSLPPRLRAGDQHAWTVQTQLAQGTFVFYVFTGVINNVPVRYTLLQPTGTAPGLTGGVQVDAAGVAAFSVASAITAKWQPGRFQWVLFSLDAQGDRQQIAEGEVRIDPDPLALAPADPRSPNEQLLAAIRTLLQGKALDDAQMYKVGNRELTKLPVKDLLYWEAVTEARVRRERVRRGEFVPTKTVGITFGGRY